MSLQPVIVGGGPAGMAAAIELARHGVRCTLLEEASRLGGVVYRGPLRDGVQLDYLGPRYSEALSKLHGDFQEQSGLIDVRLNHRVVGAEGTRFGRSDPEESSAPGYAGSGEVGPATGVGSGGHRSGRHAEARRGAARSGCDSQDRCQIRYE